MKCKTILKGIILVSIVLFASINTMQAQLANSYLHDIGIENDPNVLFVEKFDDGMTNILSRYDTEQNFEGMFLDSTDVPPGSLGPNSIKMTSQPGVDVGGYLFKQFTSGFDSTVYVRYYVKYPSSSVGYFHHEAVWFGGHNPSTTWPWPRASTCGLGDERLIVSYEPKWFSSDPSGMDSFNYWGDMKAWNDAGDDCYGNLMISEGKTNNYASVSPTAPVVDLDQWMCIEVMIKLNNPVSEYNGELRIWQNGVEVGYWGPGFPNGHWDKDKWYNNPDDPAFEGFRWRTDDKLNINWIWFNFYHDHLDAPPSHIKFDHLVMATEYIGPIATEESVNIKPDASSSIQIFPNPSSGTFAVKGLPLKSELSVYNVMGEKVFSRKTADTFLTIDLSVSPKGMYYVKIDDMTKSIIVQ